jgi:nucleoid-associated protein YgaU
MKPTSEQSNIVRQMVKTAEKQFMQQLPGRPMEPDALGGADLNARLRSLQLENEKLKRELADANRSSKALTLPVKTTGPAADKPAPNADGTPGRFRQYTITKGDSLSSIARKIYGDAGPARISAIFNANRDKMTSVNNLPKIGTVILLPE